MSSTKNLTSQIRQTQSKTLTVHINQDGKIIAKITHNTANKSRIKTYTIQTKWLDNFIYNYIRSVDWAADLECDDILISRKYWLTKTQ